MVARRIAVFLLGAVIGAAGGCASPGSDTGDPPESACELVGGPATDSAAVGNIEYRVVGGFTGQGDGTSVQIAPDGTLTRHTMKRGTEQGQLDPMTLADIVAKVRTAQFPTLCAMYACSGCGDYYVYAVSVQLDGDPYTVRASSVASSLPERLEAMIEALQALVDRPLP